MIGAPVFRYVLTPGWAGDSLARAAQAVPSLDLNFAATKNVGPLVTFTRASSATYIDSAGTLQTAAVDVPRFDHNPTTGESLGLLVEEARTNLLLNTATLSTQSVTVTAVPHTLSFYGSGTVTLSGASTAGPAVGSGAFPARTTLTFTPSAGTLTLTVTGSVTSAQLEAGSFPTSYIPTTTATVTRAADVFTITGTNFSSWYNPSEGTLSVETPNGLVGLGVTVNTSFLGISTGALSSALSTGDGIKYGSGSPSTSTRTFIITSGTAVFDSNSAINAGKVAIAYKQDDFAIARSSTLGTDTSGNVPTGMDRFTLRAFGATPYKRITYWPTRLSDATIQAITAT